MRDVTETASGADAAEAISERPMPVPAAQFVIAGAGLGLFFGLLLIFFDLSAWPSLVRGLDTSGSFVLWVALIAFETMLWTLATPFVVAIFRRHWRGSARARREAMPAAVMLALIAVGLTVGANFSHRVRYPLPHYALKVAVLNMLLWLVLFSTSLTIWLIRDRLRALASAKPTAQTLRVYLRMRADLEWLLIYLVAVITVSLLGLAARRQFIVDLGQQALPPPASAIVLNGLLLSLLVALAYVPTFATLQQTGAALRESIEPLPDPSDERFENRLAKRQAIDKLLGLSVSASLSFRVAVTILSPLLGSLLSLLPKLGS